MNISEEDNDDGPRLTGVVKWFNNKSGFGFITVCQEGHPLHAKDIFCYYKSLRVVNFQFRYLIQGEYVDFKLVKAAVEPHEYQAVDVTGVQGGPLMCETRSIQQQPRAQHGPHGPHVPTHRSPPPPLSHRVQPGANGVQPGVRAPGAQPYAVRDQGVQPGARAQVRSSHKKKRPVHNTDSDGFIQVNRQRQVDANVGEGRRL